MELFLNKYRIDSIRLKGWNYSWPAYYFVTICIEDRGQYFGQIKNDEMHFSDLGYIAYKYWLEIKEHFPQTTLDEHIIMSNHVHGIVGVNIEKYKNDDEIFVETQNFASLQKFINYKNKFGPQSKNLSSIIRGYKTGVKNYATINNKTFYWQARFYDHIIRNKYELNKIRQYIIDNPKNWKYSKTNLLSLWM
ncbi:MAG: hypothetical protein ABID45_03710 [Patescibacteria group bacterium]